MSRYTFNGERPHHKVIVGWDNPLESFFLQVWDELAAEKKFDEEPEPIFWVGMKTGEVPTVEALRLIAEPFGEIPDEILFQLKNDFGRRVQPSQSQLRVRK